MPLQPGSQLGRYEILSSLGAGGMGEVYRARDTRLGREVAIKLLREEVSSDPARLARLEREARVLASLNHPNVATLYGFEEVAGRHFLTMELVEGESLADRVVERGADLDDLLAIALEICEALEVAHAKGIVHRDLKPANILVRTGRAGPRVKVLDFGLATVRPGTGSGVSRGATLTEEGSFLGTPHYVSPEQARGETVDARSDLFSLGVVLYELATGRRPFEGDSLAEILSSILRDSATPVDLLRPELGTEIDAIVARCLAKKPEERYGSVAELRDALEAEQKRLAERTETLAETRALPVGHREGSDATARPARFEPGRGLLADLSPAKTSIAILPVEVLSGSETTRALASGLSGEISDALTRIGGVRVVSRLPKDLASSEHTDFVRLAEQFGTDHVLFMSLAQAGEKIRVKAQLHRAPEGFISWSSTSVVPVAETFELQQSIAEAVALELGGELLRIEYLRVRERATTSLDAWALTQHSANLIISGENFPSWDAAIELARRALELDPDFGPAWARLSALLGERAAVLLSESMEEDVAEARRAAEKAIQLSPYDPYVLMNAGQGWMACGEAARGRRALAKAAQLIPHDNLLWLFECFANAFNGNEEEARQAVAVCDRVREQSPMNPLGDQFGFIRAVALVRLGEHRTVADQLFEICLESPARVVGIWPMAATSLAELGEIDKARRVFEVVRDAGFCPHPSDIEPTYVRLSAGQSEIAEAFLGGLRKAGIVGS